MKMTTYFSKKELTKTTIKQLRKESKELIVDTNTTIRNISSDDIDEIDSKILAEMACISHAIEVYSNVYKELCVKKKWYQFWKESKTDEEVLSLIESYSKLGKSHPDYIKGKLSNYRSWILNDVYDEVQKSLKEIDKLKKMRGTTIHD
jgi:hypothetical protein